MQNEILKPVLDTDEVAVPRYDIVGPNGSVIQQNVELRLKNEVVQEGTPYDEESVLPASLRTQLELPQSATPAEAMAALLTKGGGAVRRNRPPLTTDADQVGKLWVVPEMFFNNLMPNALTQVAGNWQSSNATVAVSGNTATFTGNGTESGVDVQAGMLASAKVGDKIFVQATVKVNHDANVATIQLTCGEQTLATKTLDVPAAGDTMLLQAVATVADSGALVLRAHSAYNTAAVQSGKGLTVSAITVWNLTEDMCEAQEGNEFTEQEAANYISSFGQFQAKKYEYSTWWWVLRGVTDGVYLWARMFDEATIAEAQAGSASTSWMSPRRVQDFYTHQIATQSEVNAGADDVKHVTSKKAHGLFTSKLATTAEAQAGSADTKWMSPLKARQHFNAMAASDSDVTAGTNTTKWTNPKQVAGAAKTVLDTSSNTLVSIGTVPKVCKLVSTTGGSYITNLYANHYNYDDYFYMYAWGGKLYMLGYHNTTSSTSSYYPSVVEYDNNGKYATQWTSTSVSESSDYTSYMYLSGSAVSSDGSAITCRMRNYWALVDLKNRKLSSWSTSNSGYGCGVTTNYQFYFYLSAYNDRRLYYASRGTNVSSWSKYLSLGNGTNSSYYTIVPLGVSGDTVWYLEQVTDKSWKLSKAVLGSTPTYTSGVATFDASSITNATYLSFNCLYHNSTYAALSVNVTISNSTGYKCAYVLKVNLSDGSTNWSTVLGGSRVSSSDTAYSYVNASYYMGSTGGFDYFYGQSYGYVALNRSTMVLSTAAWPLGSSPSFTTPSVYGFERVNSGAYEGTLVFGTHIWQLPYFNDYGIQGSSSMQRYTNYVYGIIEMYAGATYGGHVYFAGTLSGQAPLGYSGNYSANATQILLGPPDRTVNLVTS